VDIATLERFVTNPLREHWLFSKTAKERGATTVATFAAYAVQASTANLRAYVLRPEFRKARAGELAAIIKKLAKVYGRVMTNARKDKLGKPVAVFVHIRWDN
jgi:hypothetical protein